MDKTYKIIYDCMQWINQREFVPVRFAQQYKFRVNTTPTPLIEFYIFNKNCKPTITVGNITDSANHDEIVILNSHLGNQGTVVGQWDYWCLSLDLQNAPKFDYLNRKSLFLKAKIKNLKLAQNAYNPIIQTYRREGLVPQVKLKIAVLNFLITLLTNVEFEDTEYSHYSNSVEKSLEIIHTDYRDSELNIKQLSHLSHLSSGYFGRIFKEQTGTTPMKYLAQERITRARELIQRGDLSMKEIAFEVGFRDPLYFSRLFHKSIGVSPTKYKQQKNLQNNTRKFKI